MGLTPDELEALEEVYDVVGSVVGPLEDEDSEARELFREEMARDGGQIDAIGEPRVHAADLERLCRWDDPFDCQYGIDGGTTRAEFYNNGLVMDVAKAKAAMLGDGSVPVNEPSTIIAAAYVKNPEEQLVEKEIRSDNIVSRLVPVFDSSSQEEVASEVSMYAQKIAEGLHAKRLTTDYGPLDGPLFIDGPIYPMRALSRLKFAKELAVERTGDAEWPPTGEDGLWTTEGKGRQKKIVDRYIHAIDAQFEAGYPVIGIVKTMKTSQMVSTIEDSMGRRSGPLPEAAHERGDGSISLRWARDDQFMSDVLATERADVLTFTSWLVETEIKSGDDVFEPLLGFDINEDVRGAIDYRRAFFYVRLPQSQVVFRVEAPLQMVESDDEELIRHKVLHEIAKSGDVPPVISRADQKAKISQDNAVHLKKSFKVNQTKNYNTDGRFERFQYEDDD